MKLMVQPVPASEDFGGPTDDDPDNFIDLNLPGIEGEWTHEGVRLSVAIEYVPSDRWEQPPIVIDGPRSKGIFYTQVARDESMHIEYLVEELEGRPILPSEHPFESREIADALSRWFEANPDGLERFS